MEFWVLYDCKDFRFYKSYSMVFSNCGNIFLFNIPTFWKLQRQVSSVNREFLFLYNYTKILHLYKATLF